MAAKKSSFGSKKGGFKSRKPSGGGGRSEGRSAPSSYKAPPMRKPGVPTGAVIALAAPLLAILLVVVFKSALFPDKVVVETLDPNVKLQKLQKQAAGFRREYNEVLKLAQSESAGAASRSKSLDDKLYKWLENWDRAMKPFMDKEGYVKREYRGYNSTRQTVSRLRHDLSKTKGFFDD